MQKRTLKNASPFHMAFSDSIHLEILQHIQEGIRDMRPHMHNRLEIAVCQCSGGHLLMDGEIFPVHRGDIILVYAGTVHDIRCTTEDDAGAICFWTFPTCSGIIRTGIHCAPWRTLHNSAATSVLRKKRNGFSPVSIGLWNCIRLQTRNRTARTTWYPILPACCTRQNHICFPVIRQQLWYRDSPPHGFM